MSRLLLALAVFVAGLGAGWNANGWRLGEQMAEREREKIASAAAQNEAHRLKERALNKQVEDARNAATQRELALRRDAGRARGAVDGLRDELARLRLQLPELAADACRVRADAIADILSQCVGNYRGLAEAADRIESDRQTLMDAWPK